jgi:hypothetical protein
MKKIDLGQTISILANVGVLAGIVFLGIEVQQNSAQIEQNTVAVAAQAVFELNQEANEIRRTLYPDASLTELIDKGFDDPGSLTEIESLRFDNYFGTVLNTYEAAWIYRQKGLVEEAEYAGWRDSICGMLHREGGRSFWESGKTSYADGFIEDVSGWCFK